MTKLSLANIRKDYSRRSLNEQDIADDPFQQFEKWFNEVLQHGIDEPNAMTLATVSPDGHPSARIILLKGFDHQGFYFYTNYESKKAQQIKENPRGALVFFWKELERQVRVEGTISMVKEEDSDIYFQSRPRMSRIGAWASPQSKPIPERTYLEEQFKKFEEQFKDSPTIKRPGFWGGYVLQPVLIEFWQGRSNRLHDRIQYTLKANGWNIERLAP